MVTPLFHVGAKNRNKKSNECQEKRIRRKNYPVWATVMAVPPTHMKF